MDLTALSAPTFHVISCDSAFQSLCETYLREKPALLFLDTEFTRRTTYWPTLELIQFMTEGSDVYILDCQNLTQWESFSALLLSDDITKVLHSARQDLEGLWKLMNVLPTVVFDTQIAASFLGLGPSVGLSDLASMLFDVTVDKSEQFSQWDKRPLRPEQLHYAAQDVALLKAVYMHMHHHLEVQNRLPWVLETGEVSFNIETLVQDPKLAWLRLKNHIANEHVLYYVIYFASLREQLAQAYNLTRGLVITDTDLIKWCEQLTRLCQDTPDLQDKLTQFIHNDIQLKEIFHFSFISLSLKTIQILSKRKLKTYQTLLKQGPQPQLTHKQQMQLSAVKGEIGKIASKLLIPMHYLAPNALLESYIRLPSSQHPLRQGFRQEILKEVLEPLELSENNT